MDEVFQRTEKILLQDLPELLGQMGFQVSRTVRRAPVRAQKSILGTIGFGGAHLRGAISLLGDRGVWAAGCPVELAAEPSSERILSDFVAEICNVVGGRFRRELLKLGVEIACALPTTINGWDLAMPCALAASTTWYELRTCAGTLYLRYDLTVEETFVLDEDAKVASLDSNLVFF